MPMSGQMIATASHTATIRMTLAMMPYLKNSPVVNCLELYAMAFGAAPISRMKGMPAVIRAEKKMTSPATPR